MLRGTPAWQRGPISTGSGNRSASGPGTRRGPESLGIAGILSLSGTLWTAVIPTGFLSGRQVEALAGRGRNQGCIERGGPWWPGAEREARYDPDDPRDR